MIEAIKNNPVRVYSVVAALLALATNYVDLPVPAILAVVAAIFGLGGEMVRGKVIPTRKLPAPEHGARRFPGPRPAA